MRVSDILAGGWGLVRERPGIVAVWGLLTIVLGVAAAAWVWPMVPDLLELQVATVSARANGLPPPPPPVGFFVSILGLNLIALLFYAIIFAAAVRAVALGGADRFAFLRLGMDELRLIGLAFLLTLIAFAGVIVFALAAGLIVAALVAVVGAAGLIAAVPLYLLLIGLLIWVQVRISLTGALTVLRGRMVVREAWRLTGGRFWTLLGAYVVIWLAFVAVGLGVMTLTNPQLLAMSIGQIDPAQAMAARADMAEMMTFGPRTIIIILLGSVLNAVMLAIAFGAVATAALQLDEQR